MDMNYSGYFEFPFPSRLSGEEERAKHYFMVLPDSDQLSLLNGCKSYDEFRLRIFQRMDS